MWLIAPLWETIPWLDDLLRCILSQDIQYASMQTWHVWSCFYIEMEANLFINACEKLMMKLKIIPQNTPDCWIWLPFLQKFPGPPPMAGGNPLPCPPLHGVAAPHHFAVLLSPPTFKRSPPTFTFWENTVLMHWSYVFLALTHPYVCTIWAISLSSQWSSLFPSINLISLWCDIRWFC